MTSHDITALRFWGKGGGIPSWNLYFPTLHPGWGEIASWRIKAALVMESCTMYTRLGLALQGYHSPFKVTHSAQKNVLPHEANPKIPSCCPQTVCLHQTASGIQADLFAFEKKHIQLNLWETIPTSLTTGVFGPLGGDFSSYQFHVRSVQSFLWRSDKSSSLYTKRNKYGQTWTRVHIKIWHLNFEIHPASRILLSGLCITLEFIYFPVRFLGNHLTVRIPYGSSNCVHLDREDCVLGGRSVRA